MSEYKSLYLETARKLINEYNVIKTSPVTDHTAQDLLLMFHSLKGQGMMMGYKNIAMLALQMETLFRAFVNDKKTIDEALKNSLPSPKVFSDYLDSIDKSNAELPLDTEIESIKTLINALAHKPLTLLLIEDSEFFQQIFIDKLRKEYIKLDLSDNGEDAVARIVAKKYDCILLDVIVPKKNGFEILKFAKDNNIIPGTPIIVISTLGQEDDVTKALSMGAVDYIKKGEFDFDQLIQKIESVLPKAA